MNKKLFLVLGDQLFKANKDLQGVDFVIIESPEICTFFNYHKQKLTFTLACMRDYRDFLTKESLNVNYYELKEQKSFEEVFVELARKYVEIEFYDISDKSLSRMINELTQKCFKKVSILENPQFLTSKQDFADYIATKNKRLLMNDFYIWQRKRLNLLLDNDKNPLGGSWSYDEDNRKKLPKTVDVPKIYKPVPTQNYIEARNTVLQFYPNNPGKVDDLWLPTNHEQAEELLEEFLNIRLAQFGDYEDSLSDRDPFLFHSVLSPVINNGLLTPDFVLSKLFEFCDSNPILLKDHLNSVEGFVRQIIGWREWIKGLYDNKYSENLSQYNFFNANNSLTDNFYFKKSAPFVWNKPVLVNTPLNLALEKVEQYGYNHHIERLMVLSNWMLLNEFEPMDCYTWFMEMYVDAYEWVMVPNVFGMGLFADGGIFATKPYVAGGNYLKKMSDYKISKEVEELWTDKFWDFLLKHKTVFKSNPRMAMLITAKENKMKLTEEKI
jgi:deoxyribodipyrimidine photolyase-related protein